MRIQLSARRAAWRIAGACVTCALVAAAVLAWQALAGQGPAARPGADLAVVMLGHPDRLVTVDLDTMRVVSDVGLRSFATDLVLDPAGRAITAQAGGIGDEADDVVGVYDVRKGGTVRYIKLANRNPGFLVAVGTSIFVVHGIVFDEGMAVSVVDPGAMKTVRSGLMPDSPGCTMAVADGRIWTLALDPASLEATSTDDHLGAKVVITSVDPATLERHPVGGVRMGVNQVVPGGTGRLLVLSGREDQGPAAVTAVDDVTGHEGRTIELADLRHGAMQGCIAGRRLAISEWDGEDPADEGEWVAWLDSGTLARQGRLRVRGGPCAMAAWGDRLVVIERKTARLLVIDPATARITGTVSLGHEAPVIADVAVLPAR